MYDYSHYRLKLKKALSRTEPSLQKYRYTANLVTLDRLSRITRACQEFCSRFWSAVELPQECSSSHSLYSPETSLRAATRIYSRLFPRLLGPYSSVSTSSQFFGRSSGPYRNGSKTTIPANWSTGYPNYSHSAAVVVLGSSSPQLTIN